MGGKGMGVLLWHTVSFVALPGALDMKLHMIESSDRENFIDKVNAFLDDRNIFSVKFQRNLFYSLSGSTHNPSEINRETSTLKEGYVAFIVYYEEGEA